MTNEQLVKKAQRLRVQEHRLKPSLRLRTMEDILEFIHERGQVSFLGGNELPSFISAVLGRSWRPSSKGFTGWLDWWSVKISGRPIPQVSREIEGRDDIMATRLFRRTKTFISKKVWPTLHPIVRHQRELLERGEILSDHERRLLKAIEEERSIRTDLLRKRLGLEAKENSSKFHRALANLESYSLIVGVEDPHPEKHLHANIWQTWERRTGERSGENGLTEHDALVRLFQRTMDACVLAREGRVEGWFRWATDVKPIIQELLERGDVLRTGAYLVAARVQDINS